MGPPKRRQAALPLPNDGAPRLLQCNIVTMRRLPSLRARALHATRLARLSAITPPKRGAQPRFRRSAGLAAQHRALDLQLELAERAESVAAILADDGAVVGGQSRDAYAVAPALPTGKIDRQLHTRPPSGEIVAAAPTFLFDFNQTARRLSEIAAAGNARAMSCVLTARRARREGDVRCVSCWLQRRRRLQLSPLPPRPKPAIAAASRSSSSAAAAISAPGAISASAGISGWARAGAAIAAMRRAGADTFGRRRDSAATGAAAANTGAAAIAGAATGARPTWRVRAEACGGTAGPGAAAGDRRLSAPT